MPRRDGTGPEGMGPMTGRKAGNCGRTGTRGLQNRNIADKNNNVIGDLRGFFRRGFSNSNKPGRAGRNRQDR